MTGSKTSAAAALTAVVLLAGCGGGSSTPTGTTIATGTPANAAVTLSPAALSFPGTQATTTSAPITLTVSNSGGAALVVTSVTFSGTNPAQFAQTNNCTSVAAGSSCTVSVTFKPLAAASYTASLTLTDNAGGTAGSTQTLTLGGTGTAPLTGSVTRTLLAFPEPDSSVTPLYALVNGAQTTFDMTMYALEDTTFSGDLITACKRGVTVRVILDQNLEKSGNTPAYNLLNAQPGCSAVWANAAFQATHQKSFLVDGAQVAIMSLNLQSQYYSTTRDYALIENDAADIASIQATFNADYAAGTPASGMAGASDFSYAPGAGDSDLIWSPTTAQAAMLAIINNAKSTLLVENEEMGAANIVSAFTAACQRGVQVHIAMVSSSSYTANFTLLKAAGCKVSLYANTPTGFYVHAKAVVADFGLSTQAVYMGSINYSNASMTQNRELGIFLSDSASVATLQATMAGDFAAAAPF